MGCLLCFLWVGEETGELRGPSTTETAAWLVRCHSRRTEDHEGQQWPRSRHNAGGVHTSGTPKADLPGGVYPASAALPSGEVLTQRRQCCPAARRPRNDGGAHPAARCPRNDSGVHAAAEVLTSGNVAHPLTGAHPSTACSPGGCVVIQRLRRRHSEGEQTLRVSGVIKRYLQKMEREGGPPGAGGAGEEARKEKTRGRERSPKLEGLGKGWGSEERFGGWKEKREH